MVAKSTGRPTLCSGALPLSLRPTLHNAQFVDSATQLTGARARCAAMCAMPSAGEKLSQSLQVRRAKRSLPLHDMPTSPMPCVNTGCAAVGRRLHSAGKRPSDRCVSESGSAALEFDDGRVVPPIHQQPTVWINHSANHCAGAAQWLGPALVLQRQCPFPRAQLQSTCRCGPDLVSGSVASMLHARHAPPVSLQRVCLDDDIDRRKRHYTNSCVGQPTGCEVNLWRVHCDDGVIAIVTWLLICM